MSWRQLSLYFLLYAGVILLDSAALGNFTIGGVHPDIPLLLLIFLSHYGGSMSGKLLGFSGGLMMDILGMAPLGFHALIGTVIGHFSGLLQGRLYLDAVILPALLALGLTLGKFVVVLTASLLFLPERVDAVLSMKLFIEIAVHMGLAPFIYVVLKLLRIVREYERRTL